MKLIRRDPNCGYLDTHLWIPKTAINVEGAKSALTFAFVDTYAERKVRYVLLYKEAPHHLLVPRAFWKLGSTPFPVIDCRPREYPEVKIKSKIQLDHRWEEVNGTEQLVPTGTDIQRRAFNALLENPGGILQLSCGRGKSVIALARIAAAQGPAIIVVDNTQLLEQWKGEINLWLDVPGGIGVLKGGKQDWQKGIVLATYHTLGRFAEKASEEFKRHFKVIIFEEGHHSSAATFAPALELFYGARYVLSATPKRDDGLHVIYDMHVGAVVYKNLTQDLNARVAFDWTGLTLEETRPDCKIRDKNGELSLSMLGVYFGRWKEHLNWVLKRVWEATQAGRKILVLCSSIDEAVNLCAIWNGMPDLYTDIPIPSPQDVGETLSPIELPTKTREKHQASLKAIEEKLALALPQAAIDQLEQLKSQLETTLAQCVVHDKISAEWRARQRSYIKRLRSNIKTGGLIINKIDPNSRAQYLKDLQVVFAIKKYGREGLNNRALDTVLATMPWSSRGSLQQIKGRSERMKSGKRTPVLAIMEHNIGPLINMCQKLRAHLREWPIEEGGPFTYELHGHPKVRPLPHPIF